MADPKLHELENDLEISPSSNPTDDSEPAENREDKSLSATDQLNGKEGESQNEDSDVVAQESVRSEEDQEEDGRKKLPSNIEEPEDGPSSTERPLEEPAANPNEVPTKESTIESSDGKAKLLLQELEERVRRLEDIIATVQQASASPGNSDLSEAKRVLAQGKGMLPVVSHSKPPTEDLSETAEKARRSWLLFDVYAEIRVVMRMYFDPRHRVGLQGRLLPVLLLAAWMTSAFWIPLGFLRPVVDFPLAYLLFKIVNRETTRYRETSPDLPSSLRL